VKEPRWISIQLSTFIYHQQMLEHGGMPGPVKSDLLASALSRPQQLYAYDDNADIFTLAAGYLDGICRNHPFTDGNKRVAFLCAYTFLQLNGWDFDASEPDVVIMVSMIAAGEAKLSEIAEWLQLNSAPIID